MLVVNPVLDFTKIKNIEWTDRQRLPAGEIDGRSLDLPAMAILAGSTKAFLVNRCRRVRGGPITFFEKYL